MGPKKLSNDIGLNLTGFNRFYNLTTINRYPDPIVDYLLKYLNLNSTQEAIHSGHTTHSMDNKTVFHKISEDFMQSVAHNLTELIGKYKVLLFSGNYDIMVGVNSCNGFLENKGMK